MQRENKLELVVDFLQQRISYLVDLQRSESIQDQWLSACRLVKPTLPKAFGYSGDMDIFPPRLKSDECCVIILNHVSDLDSAYLLSLMDTSYLDRPQKKQGQGHAPSSFIPAHTTIRPTAFTHSHFFKQPVLGPLLTKANLIGLYKDMPDKEMQDAIEEKLESGCNTFILFPEGGVHSSRNHFKSKAFWNKEMTGNGNGNTSSCNPTPNKRYPFKNCFLPRSGCYTNLIKTIGPRLRYFCDLTLLYPNHRPWEVDWNYDERPSVVHSCTEQLSKVYVHCKVLDFEETRKKDPDFWKTLGTHETLLKLWRKKEKRLEKMREMEAATMISRKP